MPILKMTAGIGEPKKAMEAVTKGALCVSTYNLFGKSAGEWAEEFEKISRYFERRPRTDERRYYHVMLCPDPKDEIKPEMFAEYLWELSDECFSEYQCLIAVKETEGRLCGHIVISAVSSLTGKKMDVRKAQYAALKDMANETGRKYGLTPADFRKKKAGCAEGGR